MKTIRNQLKYPIGLRLPLFLKMGFNNCRYLIFMRLQKEDIIQKNDIKQKIS